MILLTAAYRVHAIVQVVVHFYRVRAIVQLVVRFYLCRTDPPSISITGETAAITPPPLPQSLVDILDVYPYHVTTVSRSPQGPMEVEMWVYEEGVPDEIAFSVDSHCQLLGVGLCGPHGAYVVTC